jgi:hypothetical protein
MTAVIRFLSLLSLAFALLPAAAHAALVRRRVDEPAALRGDNVAPSGRQRDRRRWFQQQRHHPTTTDERYNPSTNQWAGSAPMSEPRAHATATQLPDGRVLVAGGRFDGYHATNHREIYDPAVGSWSAAGTMSEARAYHGAVLLDDGRVLVVGGDGLYNTATGAEIWNPGEPTSGRRPDRRSDPLQASVTRLSTQRPRRRRLNGTSWPAPRSITPTRDRWTQTAPMREPRDGPGAYPVADGRVLVAGGYGWVEHAPRGQRTAEIIRPEHREVGLAPEDLNRPRGEGLRMSTLSDGRPAISGGFRWSVITPAVNGGLPTWSGSRYEDTVEVFEPQLGPGCSLQR